MQRREFLKCATFGAAGLVLGRKWSNRPGLAPQPRGRHFEVLDLPRKPRERGRAHGEALKGKIVALCEEWKSALQPPLGTDRDAYIRRLVAETRFAEAARKWTPDLVEEVQGIADGSGLPFDTVLAMQLVDEEWWFGINLRLEARESRPKGDKCTAIGVSRSEHGPSLVAQNMDIPGYADGNMVILRVREPESDLDALVLTYAGLVCLNGVNNRGIGLCVNTLLDLANTPAGLPIAFVNRGVLARGRLEDAERFLREITIASGQCYNVGGPDKVVSYECSARKVVPFAAGRRTFVHANHALASDDLSRMGANRKKQRAELASQPAPGNSERRQAAAEKRLRAAGERVSVDDIKAALGSHEDAKHPVCCHHETRAQGYTAACTIFVLGDRPEMHVSAGPPCTAPFAVHRF